MYRYFTTFSREKIIEKLKKFYRNILERKRFISSVLLQFVLHTRNQVLIECLKIFPSCSPLWPCLHLDCSLHFPLILCVIVCRYSNSKNYNNKRNIILFFFLFLVFCYNLNWIKLKETKSLSVLLKPRKRGFKF